MFAKITKTMLLKISISNNDEILLGPMKYIRKEFITESKKYPNIRSQYTEIVPEDCDRAAQII